ncbi:MAG: hypothetical protein KKH98_03125 [Spirochaetes bacterium]|nr:hypothetical protein [Spirochaetota bacterium]
MKKLSLILLSLLVVTCPLFAGYNVSKVTIFTAQVTVTGTTNTALEVALFNRIDDSAATVVNWTNISVPLGGGTAWRIANQYARISYTNFTTDWGITFTSDNTNSAIASPQFTGAAEEAAGLIAVTSPSIKLPMVWNVQDATTEPAKITDPIEDPPLSGSYRFTNTGWAWKYLVDQAQSAFTNTINNAKMPAGSTVNYYATPVNNEGILWGAAASERSGGVTPVQIYLAADFATATIRSYRTTTLTVEMFKP